MAELSPAVKAALDAVKGGRNEHQSRLKRYNDAYDVYMANPKARNMSPWRSQLRPKYAHQVINTELVNIVSGQPRFMITPRHPDGEDAAKNMQALFDYYLGEDHFSEAQVFFTQQALVYGTTVGKCHWLYRETARPVKSFQHNPLDPTVPIENVQMSQVVTRDGPTFEPWNIYHCFWEPGARNVDDAAYVVLQSWVTKDDLRQLAFNPQSNTGIYNNVEQLIATGAAQQPEATAQARRLHGGAPERYKDRFLIEEIWTDDELVVIGNGQIELRRQPNPYWHGRKPIVIAQTLPDLFEMAGISETELVDHLQQALHTNLNMRFDNAHMTVMRGVTYREGSIVDPNQLELMPGFRWPVTDHDDIRPFELQPLPPEAYEEEKSLLSILQMISGVNPYVSGSDLQTVDQNTATGVTALQEVAGRLMRFKAAQLQKAYQRVGEMWGDMIQQFLDQKIAVKIEGPGNESAWLQAGPADVAGHFDYKIEGSEESLSRQQERGEAIALLNAMAPLMANMPNLNLEPVLERVALAYDFPNPQALFKALPQQPAAAPVPDQQFNPQIRGAMLGTGVPQSHLNNQVGNIANDPQLRDALARIGSGATNG